MGTITAVLTNIGEALSWIWGRFDFILNVILDPANSILLYVVLFPIVIGAIAFIMKLLRKFGVR